MEDLATALKRIEELEDHIMNALHPAISKLAKNSGVHTDPVIARALQWTPPDMNHIGGVRDQHLDK